MTESLFFNEMPAAETAAAWDGFNDSHPHGNAFHSTHFYRLCLAVPGYTPVAVIISDGGRIAGLWQCVIIREPGAVKGYLSRRAIFHGAPLLSDGEAGKQITSAMIKALKRMAIYAEIRNPVITEAESLLAQYGFSASPHLEIYHDLSIQEEKRTQLLHKERKRNISIALANGVSVQMTEKEEEVISAAGLIMKVYHNAGLPAPPEELLSMAPLILGTRVRIFTAWCDGKLAGTRFLLLHRDSILDWYAGSDPAYYKKYVNDLLVWEVMKWGADNGFRTFDFGGAGTPGKQYGVRDYKIKFGGVLTESSRYTLVFNPVLMKAGEAGIRVYKSLTKKSR